MIMIDAHIDGHSRSVRAKVQTYKSDGIGDFATLDIEVDGAEIRFFSHKNRIDALRRIAEIFNNELCARPPAVEIDPSPSPAPTDFDATGIDIPF